MKNATNTKRMVRPPLHLLHKMECGIAFCLLLLMCLPLGQASAQTSSPTILLDEVSKNFNAAVDEEDTQWYVVRFDNFPPDQVVTLELDDPFGFFSLKVFDSSDEYSSQITIQPGPDGYLRDTDISVRYAPSETGEHTATIYHKNPLVATREIALVGEAFTLGPLPVDLIYFTASVRQSSVALNWKAAPDPELTHFLLEVSYDPMEGFTRQDSIPSTSHNSTQEVEYSLEFFPGSRGGTHYFRIGQVYTDQSVTYSGVLSVEISPISETSTAVSPNPFRGSSHLIVKAVEPGQLKVSLCNLSGTQVLSQVYHVVDGENNLVLDTYESMPAGMYILTAELNGTANKLKLFKQ